MIVTCEHAVNSVPSPYMGLFAEKPELLESHSAWDPGALELAGAISNMSGALLYEGGVSRLLVDLNRSLDNRKGIFSGISRKLSNAEREEIVNRYYMPFRRKVEDAVRESVGRGEKVLHFSVHTFTPVMKGRRRRGDIGLLYDTARPEERELALEVRKRILSKHDDFTIRLNYPYPGKTDGHAAYMRRHFPQENYVGLEIEANQAIFYEGGNRWERLKDVLARSLSGPGVDLT